MKFNHLVKYNGEYYPAGTEVPVGVKPVENKKVEEVKVDFSKNTNPPVDNVKVVYTKTEINRMSTAELKEIAKANDVKEAEDMTGAELKKVLIDKFNF